MCPTDDLALHSRYVHAYHHIPEYRPDDPRWVQTVESILQQTTFQLLIPCNDQAVIPVQIYHNRLSRFCRIYSLEDHAFRMAFDKIAMDGLARDLGIPRPKSKVVAAGESAEAVLQELALPVVLKPPSSFTAEDLSAKRTVARARTYNDLTRSLRASTDWGRILIQENFIGTGVGVELLARAGRTLVAFQHVRVHEPLEGGGSSYRKSVALDPGLLAASQSLIRALDYTGVAMVEFKVNVESGEWIFVEINGRFWGSLPLALAAGVDFPLYLYDMLVNGRSDFPKTYRAGMHCRSLTADCEWLVANLAANRRDPTLATRALGRVSLEGLNILRLRERWDTLTGDDPRPGLYEGRTILRDILRKVAHVARRRVATTYLARKVASFQLLRRTRTATTLLFVCKGNICRSPFAERYAREVLPGHITIHSCGYYPANDRLAPDSAQIAAREFGVELSEHRSTVITQEMVERADVILTFDEDNSSTLHRTHPAAAARVFPLGVLPDGSSSVIRDPYGGDLVVFKSVYRQIARKIDYLASRLTSGHAPPGNVRMATSRKGS
jgi:protein-tyrosine-phosphatase/predicted ATP-grasp superfamily ATP-dependent carboligase